MPDRCKAVTKNGQPCKNWCVPGEDVCSHPAHMKQRTLSAEAVADNIVAFDMIARLEVKLKQRIPSGKAEQWMLNLRTAAAASPDLVAVLVGAASLPDGERSEKILAWVDGFEKKWKHASILFNNPDADLQESVEDSSTLSSPDYPFRGEPEIDILMRCSGAGSRRIGWEPDPATGAPTYVNPEVPGYQVRLEITEQERDDGIGRDRLWRLVTLQDADAALALLYVSRLLAPAGQLPVNTIPAGPIDLNNVIISIGWAWRSKEEHEEMRRAIWAYLCFFAQAGVYGQRNSVYRDPITGERIPTVISGPIWSLQERERPIQPALMESFEIPMRVVVAMTGTWTRLITDPRLIQYLPLAELLGGIKNGSQASGAWARCIGMSLVHRWMSDPAGALSGSIRPTRRELLFRYTPKVSAPEEVLSSDKPHRLRTYWAGALRLLSYGIEFIQPSRSDITELGRNVPKNWHESWLEERVPMLPGKSVRAALEDAAYARLSPVSPPVLKRGRGRPRKVEK
jgi:hypothetical protein